MSFNSDTWEYLGMTSGRCGPDITFGLCNRRGPDMTFGFGSKRDHSVTFRSCGRQGPDMTLASCGKMPLAMTSGLSGRTWLGVGFNLWGRDLLRHHPNHTPVLFRIGAGTTLASLPRFWGPHCRQGGQPQQQKYQAYQNGRHWEIAYAMPIPPVIVKCCQPTKINKTLYCTINPTTGAMQQQQTYRPTHSYLNTKSSSFQTTRKYSLLVNVGTYRMNRGGLVADCPSIAGSVTQQEGLWVTPGSSGSTAQPVHKTKECSFSIFILLNNNLGFSWTRLIPNCRETSRSVKCFRTVVCPAPRGRVLATMKLQKFQE